MPADRHQNRRHSAQRDKLPHLHADRKQDDAGGKQQHHRRAEVRLCHDQRGRHQRHHQRRHDSADGFNTLQGRSVEIFGQRHHQRDLHQFGGLQFDKFQINPAGGTHAGIAGHFNHNQQRQGRKIKRISIAQKQFDVDHRRGKHYRKPQRKTQRMVDRPAVPSAVGGGIKHHHAGHSKQGNQYKIGKVQMTELFPKSKVRIMQSQFIGFIHHLPFSLSSFSASRRSFAPIGAATEEPPPPCSTSTATAYFGLSCGA